jgi:hypothetical protein
MGQRQWLSALAVAGTVSCLLGGCSKKDNPSTTEAIASPNAAVQMNISGALPVVLGPDTIQSEIDKAGSGVNLVQLDLNTLGLPLTLDAPEGAKAERDPHKLSLRRESGDVEISAGDHFAIRIRLGTRPFDQKRRQLAGQKVFVNTKDLILSSSMLLLDERCEFARHVLLGDQDYTIENVDPLIGRQINHSQADCLLMLKCIGTLRAKMPPASAPTDR